MTVDDALAVLLQGPTERADVHGVLLAAGLLRMASGTGPTWTLTPEGRERLAALRERNT